MVKRQTEKNGESVEEFPPRIAVRADAKRRRAGRRKWIYVIAAVVLLAAAWYFWHKKNGDAEQYELFEVKLSDLTRTVEVTGEVKPSSRVDLSFERNGTLAEVFVKVGDKVAKGDPLAELEDEDARFAERSARAALAAAQAKLDLEQAGEKEQTIRKAETVVEQAEADLEKAKADLENARVTAEDAVRTAEIAVQTAKNSLDNQSAQLDQDVLDAYDDARVVMINALGPMDSALTEGDKIVGVDDTATNAAYKQLLGVSSAGSMDRAETSYASAKAVKTSADALVRTLDDSSPENTEEAADRLLRALSLVQTFLTDVQNVLSGTITGTALSATDLAGMKTKISNERTTLSTQYANVQNAIQAITTAKLERTDTKQSLEDAYETAVVALNTAKTDSETSLRTAETNVTVKEAALRSAEADLELKRSPPRNVDLEPLRAAVSEARVKYDQAAADLRKMQIIAPMDGVISAVLPEAGERMAMNETAVTMISESLFDVESLIPEADIALVKIGQEVLITLDAYGDDVEFAGSVISEEPDQTVIQDAVYYKCRMSVETGERELKPGMTANANILVASAKDVFAIPARAVRTDEKTGEKKVMIFENGKTRDQVVQTGLRGDEGKIAVTNGLKEGDMIVVSEK
jgi:multidrug efflux pump subunit AcrA (membrane-fusion protein)